MSEVKEWWAMPADRESIECTHEQEDERQVLVVPKADLDALWSNEYNERVRLNSRINDQDGEIYQLKQELQSKDQELQTLRTAKSAMSDVIEAKDQRINNLVKALENAKADFNDLDTILMADHKIVLSGFSRAKRDVTIAINKALSGVGKLNIQVVPGIPEGKAIMTNGKENVLMEFEGSCGEEK